MLAVLWLVGINLRTVVLSVPPALPALHAALHLSYSAAGLLTSLPVLLMAAGAIPGAYLVSRLGAREAVVVGLALITIGTALRGAVPNIAILFLFTAVLAIGIAVSQPAVPSLTQAWFPHHIGRATAIYSNGLLVGEVIAATITLPLLVTPFGWQVALGAWAVVAAFGLILWLALTPPTRHAPGAGPAWLPDWRNGAMVRLGLMMAAASLVYFGMNIWIPDTLDARHAHALIPLTLGLLNFMQIPVSFLLAVVGDRLLGRRTPYLVGGVMSLMGVAGYALAPVATAPLWAGIAGAGASLAFILNLGLPALLKPSEVARTTGFMFALGYAAAFFGPALGGIAWDWTGAFWLALLPMVLGAAAMLVLGASLGPLAVTRLRRPAASSTGS